MIVLIIRSSQYTRGNLATHCLKKNHWAMEHTCKIIKLFFSGCKTGSRILMCRLRILGTLHPAFTKLKSFWLRAAIIIYNNYLSLNAYQITVMVNIRSNVLGSYKTIIALISVTRTSFR